MYAYWLTGTDPGGTCAEVPRPPVVPGFADPDTIELLPAPGIPDGE